VCVRVCVRVQNKERDESFKLELTGTDCEGASIGRIAKTIVTVIDDDGQILVYLLTCSNDPLNEDL